MNRRTALTALLAGASAPMLAACSSGITSLNGGGSGGDAGSSSGGLVIGTANFTENQILGYLYAGRSRPRASSPRSSRTWAPVRSSSPR